jgi:hypothetical protein
VDPPLGILGEVHEGENIGFGLIRQRLAELTDLHDGSMNKTAGKARGLPVFVS